MRGFTVRRHLIVALTSMVIRVIKALSPSDGMNWNMLKEGHLRVSKGVVIECCKGSFASICTWDHNDNGVLGLTSTCSYYLVHFYPLISL